MLPELFSKDKQRLPNKFTKAMGELTRRAREESGMSQAELAAKTYRRQAAISDIENGRMEVNASTLVLLSYILQKPLTYFFPDGWISDLPLERLSQREQVLLIQAHRLGDEDLQRLIAQVRALADLAEREVLENIKADIQKENINKNA